MTYTYEPSAKPGFDFGRVLSRTFESIRDNWLPFSLASLVIIGLPYFLINLIPAYAGLYENGMFSGNDLPDNFVGVMIAFAALGGIVVILSSFVLQASVIHAAVKGFQGHRTSFSESLVVAFKHLLPIIGFALLGGLAMMLGFLLFIVPGIILMLMWYVAIPVMVVEKTGVMGAFERSAELTSGYKWWILLAVIVLAIIGAVISAVVLAASLIFGVPTQQELMLEGAATMPVILYAVANGVATAFSTLVSAAGVAAIYYELRYIKEGVEAESIGSVFS